MRGYVCSRWKSDEDKHEVATLTASAAAISFIRDPAEHYEVMRGAGRRFSEKRGQRSVAQQLLRMLGSVIAFAAVVVLLEGMRRYILVRYLGFPANVDIGDIAVLFALVAIVVVLILAVSSRWITARYKNTIRARIRPGIRLDVRYDDNAIDWDSGGSLIRLTWPEIQNITINRHRVEFDTDTFVSYVPVRAFSNETEFRAFFAQIDRLWQTRRVVEA